MTRPTASVAMATYNGARFIGAQLDSILAQTECPDEIVVSDDGSTDATLAILADHAARATIPIRVHRNDARLGFTGNFARTIALCRSELIFLCDQDDVWMPTKVARIKDAFADPSVFLAYHAALVVSEDDRPLHPFYDGERERALLAARPADPWYSTYGLTQAFRASLRVFDDLWPTSLNHVWIEDEPLAHDQWYFFLAQLFGRIVFVDETLIRYRQHGSNSVGAAWSDGAQGVVAKLKAKLAHDPRIDRLRYRAADRRAVILDEIARRQPGEIGNRAGRLVNDYRRLAQRLHRRHQGLTAASIATRVAMLARAIAGRDYGRAPWAFNRLALLRDVVGCVSGAGVASADRRDR